MEYKFDVLELNPEGLSPVEYFVNKGTKIIYNVDGELTASKWVRQEVKNKKCNLDYPKLSTGLTIKQSGYSKLCEGAFGYYYNNGNNVYYNGTNVSMFTSCFSGKSGLPVIPENFIKTATMFSARKLIESNWVNCKDEYFAPNEEHEQYSQFTNDSIIYSLFNNSSQQSSLRQIIYKDQLWDIKNEFFWMSKNEIFELANNNNYDELYGDARADSDRYVFNLLFGEQNIYDQLSSEAKDVLDLATNLVRLSINLRRNFADDHNHLNSWDAGYTQLKLIWKEFYPDQFKEFRLKYKILEEKMRPLVYELGFLLK
jgi:hypothetical protein